MLTKNFLGINFWNGNAIDLLKAADAEGGLFTVPSAPSLAQTHKDEFLARAYQASDWAVVDGGYVALILRFVFGKNLPRISGLQLLQRLIQDPTPRVIPFEKRKILWVVPSESEKARISYYLTDNGFPSALQHWYLAPFYQKDEDFMDQECAAKVAAVAPDWIVMCIGGGKQEKLGYFLKESRLREDPSSAVRKNGPVILCTGGAIAFISGGQASIPTWADRLYLGWFFRVLRSPRTFLPRYWTAAWQFPLLLWRRRDSLFEKK